ncbi:MAG: efflux RND transporter periplasmic adaptor subunit [Planctomycetota bacterium]
MDLERLRIPEKAETPGRARWALPAVGAACLLVGLVAGRLLAPGGPREIESGRTAVVTADTGGSARSFTAGGWIEVSTPRYPVFVTSRVSERLDEILVKEGDVVGPGRVVARMYDADLRTRLALAGAKRELARQTFEKLKAGYRKEDVLATEAKMAAAAEELRIAKANYERSRNLAPGAISAQELDEELSRLNEARAEHERAGAELAKMRAGNRREDVAIAEAKLRQAAAETELAERSLSYATVRAPEAGKPLRVLEVRRHVGDWVDIGKAAEILSLYDPDEMQVRVDVNQKNIKSVTVGGKVVVTTEADRARRYSGAVLRIEPLAVLAKNTITVRIGIDDPDEYLFPEMTAQIMFLAPESPAGGRSQGLLVPRGAVMKDALGSYVLVEEGGARERRGIEVLGSRGQVVIVKGDLSSGQRVVVSGAPGAAGGGPTERGK